MKKASCGMFNILIWKNGIKRTERTAYAGPLELAL
jgi:hypothetical protein